MRAGSLPMDIAGHQNHAITVWCSCGHSAGVLVRDLDPTLTIDQALTRFRCSRCGRRGRPPEIRISFVMPSARGKVPRP